MAPVYTPMKSGGLELDLEAVPAYAQVLAGKSIMHVMPAGTNGEFSSLSIDERKRLTEAWAKAAPPLGINVYVHVGCESLIDAIDLAKHAARTPGVSGITSITPSYFKPTVQSLHDFLALVARAAPELPFWYYHFPDATGVLPGQAHKLLELVEKTQKNQTLMGIKFTDYNLMDFQACTAVGHAGKYDMLFGRDEDLYAALDLGADGAVSSTCQFSPTIRNVMSLFAQGDKDGSRKAQIQNAELCLTFSEYPDKNVQKSIMKMTGFDVGPSRLPKVDLDDLDYNAYWHKLSQANLIDTPVQSTPLSENSETIYLT